ncbi:hypothetical protein BGW36DRAFT_16656 [Talaromyces proteolyticus]|uniref:Succinate dehydrogenase assembly factor 4, mitochondrial n=1 Tax=Talaromyces proteolyticus TaxID=1131652 RepID=A0AAD4Q6I2_9EURO|nr:uncharacterized protein BGW36DRAFT_16656 [Talaromyces proteolyticus]KAH8705673.1 hypothetical protein BGW36DRAFT_16656 [Talaromyces proteolyticus]
MSLFSRTLRTTATALSYRPLLTAPRHSLPSYNRHLADKPAFGDGPAPPRLPKEEQEIFEELQRQSTGAFSTPRSAPPKINQSPDSQPQTVASTTQSESKRASAGSITQGEELHPDMRQGVKPEFDGEKNPKTGEIGGPKNEPLRWGHQGDWSYNGRVTDF